MDVCSVEAFNMKKQRVYNRVKHHCRENDWSEYKTLKKEVKHMLKFQHKTYLTDMIFSPNNKKHLWRYTKAQRQQHTGISVLKAPIDGRTITDPSEKADILNQYFKSVFTEEGSKNIPHKSTYVHLYIHPCQLLRSLHREFITYCRIVTHTNHLVQTLYIHTH